MSNRNFMLLTDGYKLDHRRQYPLGTQGVYSNMTPRTSRVPEISQAVYFGGQYFRQHYLVEQAYEHLFNRPRGEVLAEYESFLRNYVGPVNADAIGIDHIAALHDLGYIPLRFYALPEGTRVPLRVPMFTYENTLPEFYWVTNYFETLMSSVIWPACTSATTSARYRDILTSACAASGGNPGTVPFQAHDFSFRGMMNPEAAAVSGAGHLLSFTGSDVLPAIELLANYYDTSDGIAGMGVPATEHSVMCAGGKDSEADTYARLLDLYPEGIVSVVSDTWDLWHVVTNILPQLKDKIMARSGTLVIRPDSGDPADILCGTNHTGINVSGSPEFKGLIELLWDIFGGTTDSQGFKTLDSHIGAIYGDSITPERCQDICDRLRVKGFASTNVVLGIGSYTFQHVTRDTLGFAIKSTWTLRDGIEHKLMKDPVTDNGVKKSATGRLVVIRNPQGNLQLLDGLTTAQQRAIGFGNLLKPVWADGKAIRTETLSAIRKQLWPQT